MPKWEKGQSGNPNGRAPKGRALTEILERTGAASVEVDGKKVSGKRLLGQLLWGVATTGCATFPDGSILTVSSQDWIAIVKFIYQHIDGPPKTEVDVTSNGESIVSPIAIVKMPVDEL